MDFPFNQKSIRIGERLEHSSQTSIYRIFRDHFPLVPFSGADMKTAFPSSFTNNTYSLFNIACPAFSSGNPPFLTHLTKSRSSDKYFPAQTDNINNIIFRRNTRSWFRLLHAYGKDLPSCIIRDYRTCLTIPQQSPYTCNIHSGPRTSVGKPAHQKSAPQTVRTKRVFPFCISRVGHLSGTCTRCRSDVDIPNRTRQKSCISMAGFHRSTVHDRSICSTSVAQASVWGVRDYTISNCF